MRVLLALMSLSISTSLAIAAFPDDFESGVILVEETRTDGDIRRAAGLNDGGLNGNVAGLREFLNGAVVDPTLTVEPAPPISFGPEIDFFHDRRDPTKDNNWPDGPEAQLAGINGVVWVFFKLDERGLPPGFVPLDPEVDPFNQPDPSKAGLWAGGTWEFIGVGRHDRNVSAMTGPRRLRFGPARGFVPQDGQVLGFMISAVTRNGIQRAPIQARTNVAFARITGLPALQSDGFFPPVQVGVDQLTRQEVAELFGVEEVNSAKVVPSVNLLLDD